MRQAVSGSSSDVKELIPEFYTSPGSFLTTPPGGLGLGTTQAGEVVGDVSLPPWAKDARDFTSKLRVALESDHVSSRLHLWIDLIFGHAQRGAAAARAHNLFHPMSYEGAVRRKTPSEWMRICSHARGHAAQWAKLGLSRGSCCVFAKHGGQMPARLLAVVRKAALLKPHANGPQVDLEGVMDSKARRAILEQISEFGQTPMQLFKTPHPVRAGASILIHVRSPASSREQSSRGSEAGALSGGEGGEHSAREW